MPLFLQAINNLSYAAIVPWSQIEIKPTFLFFAIEAISSGKRELSE
jgi:hypothetical protein